MQRHDLAFVEPLAWRAVLAARADLVADSLIAGWADRYWPLIGRRPLPDEGDGVPLGLPLPPTAGKRRLAFLVPPREIFAVMPPPTLTAVRATAPAAWCPTLDRLGDLARQHRVTLRVFGSLAWAALTHLDYLTGRSDLDLLVSVRRDTDICDLATGIAAIEASAPMRLDGEFVRADGAAVNWREIHGGARQVLMKSTAGAHLLDAAQFLYEGTMS